MATEKAIVDCLVNEFGYPKASLFNRVVAKDNFNKQAKADSKQRSKFNDNVRQVNWLFLIKSDNTNIREGKLENIDFKEIDYLHIELKSKEEIQSVAKMVFLALTKPALLHFMWTENGKNKHRLVGAEYGMNAKKLIPKSIHYSKVIDSSNVDLAQEWLNFNRQPQIDLAALYNNLLKSIEQFNFESVHGEKLNSRADVLTINATIQNIEITIQKLEAKAKHTKQLNQRIELINQIRKLRENLMSIKAGEDE